MALDHVQPYIEAISRAVHGNQATTLKLLFRIDNGLLHQALFRISEVNKAQLLGACRRKLDSPWIEVVESHIRAMQQRAEMNADAAFKLYTAADGPFRRAVDALQEAEREDINPGLCPLLALVLEQMLDNVYILAREADAQLALAGDDSKFQALGGFLQQVAHNIGFATNINSAAKTRASLTLLITMTRVYMKLNNVAACAQVLKTFNNKFSPAVLQAVPAAYRVSAYYNLGRTEVNSGNLEGGITLLEKAFQECKADSRNVQVILRFLLPLKMLQGKLPSEQLLQQFGLQEYQVFREAVATGDVGLFERSMQLMLVKLVGDGTYLLYEKLVFLVYRRLAKRIIDIARPTRDEKIAHHLPLDVMLGVLQQQQVDIDMDQLECVIANLIVQKYLKGYISNKQKTLVLSKDDPFPGPCREWWTDPITEPA